HFYFYLHCALSDLHSFPTRRSSDLSPAPLLRLVVPLALFFLGQVLPARLGLATGAAGGGSAAGTAGAFLFGRGCFGDGRWRWLGDRKSTRLNSSHVKSSYAVFCL